MKAFNGVHAAPNPSRKTLHRLVAALALLAAVVVGFSLTVFAYFTDSLVNAGNTIAAGRFSADLAVTAYENGDNPLYNTQAGVERVDDEVLLDGYAGQKVYVRLSAGADSTVAFQFRLTVEGGGHTLLAVPESGVNPVLAPDGEALTYAVEVPADGRLTLHLDTAFCAAVLTGALTTTTTTASPTTAPAPADNGLTGEPSAEPTTTAPSGTAGTTVSDEGEPADTTDSSATLPSADGETSTEVPADGGQTTIDPAPTGSADGEAGTTAPSREEGAATTAAADAAAE